MKVVIKIILVSLIILTFSVRASVNEAPIDKTNSYIKITGNIYEENEYITLKTLVNDLKERNIKVVAVYLNASDSEWDITAKMADIIYENKLTTVVAGEDRCEGGCVQLFVAGYSRVSYPDGVIEASPPRFPSKTSHPWRKQYRHRHTNDIFIPAYKSGIRVWKLNSLGAPILFTLKVMFIPNYERYFLTNREKFKLSTEWNSKYYKDLYLTKESKINEQ